MYHPIRYEIPKEEYSKHKFPEKVIPTVSQKFKVLDLCCGAGGFSGGLFLGNENLVPYMAVDIDEDSIASYAANWRPQAVFCMEYVKIFPWFFCLYFLTC
jgi:predicted RNA methylase